MTKKKKEGKSNKHFDQGAWEYTITRIDLLVISLSSGGIYLTISLIKYLYERFCYCHLELTWIKISGLLFTITLITNLISQFIALYIHNNSPDHSKFDNAIDYLNYGSLITLVAAIIILATQILVTF